MSYVAGKRRRELERQRRMVAEIGTLFSPYYDDLLLDPKAREDLRVTLHTLVEGELEFRRLLRRSGPLVRDEGIDYLCDSIRASVDAFVDVGLAWGQLSGRAHVRHPHGKMSLRQLMSEYHCLFTTLRARKTPLLERIAAMFSMMRVELIVYGSFFLVDPSWRPSRRVVLAGISSHLGRS